MPLSDGTSVPRSGRGKSEISYNTKRYGPDPRPEPYDPTRPWSEYALDQAEWRLSVGLGTGADRAALAHQRPASAGGRE